MKIGKIDLNLPLILAPMAGVTDYPFRLLCKEQGAALVFSEFVSADGIIRENAKTLKMIKISLLKQEQVLLLIIITTFY